METSGFISLADVAEELAVSYWTVRRWAQAGQIKCIRLPSGTLRVPREELNRLAAAELKHEQPS